MFYGEVLMIFFAAALILLVSVFLTYLVRKLALRKQLMDMPNHRSAHQQPTPRGGGLAIILSFFCSMVMMAWLFGSTMHYLVLLLAGCFIGWVGWLDDHGHVASYKRLLVHILASSLLILVVGAIHAIPFGPAVVALGWFGIILTLLAMVWLLNLYNFMDGINGLAASEAVFVSLAMAFILLQLEQTSLATLWLFLAASTAGFLVWNFPRAFIFMGDVGSGFLGFTIAGALLISSHVDIHLLWAGLILLGSFIVDSTFTLLRRGINGEAVYEAHSSHAYQHAARFLGSHTKVTFCVVLINVFWLMPFAYSVALNLMDGALALIIAYAPLLILAWRLNAGIAPSSVKPDSNSV